MAKNNVDQQLKPLDRGNLELLVNGVRSNGRTVKPGFLNKNVTVVLADQRQYVGECLGFLSINNDASAKSPFLTLRSEHESGVTLFDLPPQRIVGIEEEPS